MSILRVAVAGTGGLARLIAYFIDKTTSHHVVFLSRTTQPRLTADGYQVAVVDYTNRDSLRYALRGIDTVISTVTGLNQIELIHAAVEMRVRRFAPAEFEGQPDLRLQNDPLDRHRGMARQWLAVYAPQIQSTLFVCGILYERFQPGGLRQSRIGMTSDIGGEGDYIMDIRNMNAQVPVFDSQGQPNVTICMTAATDVARYVTRTLDLEQWSPIMTMCGERMNIVDLVHMVESMRGVDFVSKEIHNLDTLTAASQATIANGEYKATTKLHALIATAQGQYEFQQPAMLNAMFPSTVPLSFRTWFISKWGIQ